MAKNRFLHIFRGNFEKISAEADDFFKKSVPPNLLYDVYKRYKRYVYIKFITLLALYTFKQRLNV